MFILLVVSQWQEELEDECNAAYVGIERHEDDQAIVGAAGRIYGYERLGTFAERSPITRSRNFPDPIRVG